MEENIIDSAEEYFNKYSQFCQFEEGNSEYLIDKEDFIFCIREFAKLHVEAALKAASEKARCCDDAIVDLGHTIVDAYVEEDSILNAYPLDKIK